jgi:polyisoprenoid-binding protein YceI
MSKLRFTLAATAAVALLATGLTPAARAAETFDIDGVHSTAVFRVKHLNAAPFYGRFNDISGAFTYDAEKPAASSFEVTIKAESVDTNSERRDNHVKSPDFLNAKQFPTITLKSKSVKKTGENTLQATAELALHGVKRDVTVDIEHVGGGDRGPRFGFRRGFDVAFTFKRSDFGMDFMLEGLGDEIRLMVGIEGVLKK